MNEPRVCANFTRFALIGWAVATTVSAQGLGTLTGTVTTVVGTPVEGLRLTFTGTDVELTAVTDADGDYRLEGLAAGRYSPAIDDASQVVEPAFPITVVADITIRRDFTLRSATDVPTRLRGGDRLLGSGPGLTATLANLDAFEVRDHAFATFLRRVPGVTVNRAGGVGQPTAVRLRGAPVGDRFLLTDGLPFPGFGSELDAATHLEWARFEAVRGMTSTRHGDLAGGAQRLTKVAGDARTRRVSLGVETGELGWRQVEAATTGRRGDYDWSIAGQRIETDNEQPNSAFMRNGVAGTVGLVREDLSVDFTFRGARSTVGRPGPTSLLRADRDASEERTRLMSGVTLGLRRGQSLHEGRLVVSRTERRALNPEDSGTVDLRPVDRTGLRFDLPDFVHADGLRDDQQSAQLVYEYTRRADEFHFLNFGGWAEVRAGRFGLDEGFDQQRLNLVAYGEDRMQVQDNLTVTAGGRVERHGPLPDRGNAARGGALRVETRRLPPRQRRHRGFRADVGTAVQRHPVAPRESRAATGAQRGVRRRSDRRSVGGAAPDRSHRVSARLSGPHRVGGRGCPPPRVAGRVPPVEAVRTDAVRGGRGGRNP